MGFAQKLYILIPLVLISVKVLKIVMINQKAVSFYKHIQSNLRK